MFNCSLHVQSLASDAMTRSLARAVIKIGTRMSAVEARVCHADLAMLSHTRSHFACLVNIAPRPRGPLAKQLEEMSHVVNELRKLAEVIRCVSEGPGGRPMLCSLFSLFSLSPVLSLLSSLNRPFHLLQPSAMASSQYPRTRTPQAAARPAEMPVPFCFRLHLSARQAERRLSFVALCLALPLAGFPTRPMRRWSWRTPIRAKPSAQGREGGCEELGCDGARLCRTGSSRAPLTQPSHDTETKALFHAAMLRT